MRKLIATLSDKKKYILHHAMCIQQGLKIDRIYKVVKFNQAPFLKQYIEFNSAHCKVARNTFEEMFFKMMNNAVFGKTMEDVRKRVGVSLAHTQNRLRQLVNKTSFKRLEIYKEDLVAVENANTKILLNKPIYVGQSILDLSKVIMYNFHFNVIRKKYKSNATLLFTDTDSPCYEIKTSCLYTDL